MKRIGWTLIVVGLSMFAFAALTFVVLAWLDSAAKGAFATALIGFLIALVGSCPVLWEDQ